MPRSPWPRSSPPTRPSSGASCAASSGRSSGSSRPRTPTRGELADNEINAGLYAFDAAWLRRRIETAGAVGRDRRAVPDRARPARPRGRPARQRGRLRGRRPVRRHQRPLAARRRRVEPAGPPQRGSTCATGSRCATRPRSTSTGTSTLAAGRHPRAERHPARRDVGRGGHRHRRRQPAHRQPRSGPARAVWASDHRVLDDRGRGHGRAVQPPAPGQRRRTRRRGRQLTPSSRTPASAPARSSTT